MGGSFAIFVVQENVSPDMSDGLYFNTYIVSLISSRP